MSGTLANGRFGPDLAHSMSRDTIAAGAAPNTPENLRLWIRNPNTLKPGSLMPARQLNENELDALTAYPEPCVAAISEEFAPGPRSVCGSSKRRSWHSMEYFGASIQTRNAGHRHQTRSRANIMAEIAITIRFIIVWSSPALDYIESARMRPVLAADLL